MAAASLKERLSGMTIARSTGITAYSAYATPFTSPITGVPTGISVSAPFSTTVPATSTPQMGLTKYPDLLCRLMISGRLTAAAFTLISTSLAFGSGLFTFVTCNSSAPPGCLTVMAFISNTPSYPIHIRFNLLILQFIGLPCLHGNSLFLPFPIETYIYHHLQSGQLPQVSQYRSRLLHSDRYAHEYMSAMIGNRKSN